MKYRIDELEGALLDAAVAVALGMRTAHRSRNTGVAVFKTCDTPTWLSIECLRDGDFGDDFEPSFEWHHAGPIIERERIELLAVRDGFWRAGFDHFPVVDSGESSPYLIADCEATGPTPLIAAMRAFVKSKLGDEVEPL